MAFLIDTGDPNATAGAFTAAVDQIRGTAISCNLAIPKPPGGRTFDKEKVAVRYTSGGGANGPRVRPRLLGRRPVALRRPRGADRDRPLR